MSMYMVFRIDREYDSVYGSHSETVSFRGIREGLSDLFTDPAKSDELVTRDGNIICAYTHRGDHAIQYLAVPMPTKEGTGPEFAVTLFESCH